MITTLFTALINILFNGLFIPLLGIWGAALSTMISYLFLGTFRMLHSRKYFRFYIDFRAVFFSILLLFVQCAAVSADVWPVPVSLFCFGLMLLVNAGSARALAVLIRDTAKKLSKGNEVKK
ncbi:hypothetical protein SDC9_172210 [bioreactor metagenome]|uniref:Uncharacterized protein n=1 Tax=bioreactor metagenome TaxID=1076179 RepID=A0A645GD28_9ZZZZ